MRSRRTSTNSKKHHQRNYQQPQPLVKTSVSNCTEYQWLHIDSPHQLNALSDTTNRADTTSITKTKTKIKTNINTKINNNNTNATLVELNVENTSKVQSYNTNSSLSSNLTPNKSRGENNFSVCSYNLLAKIYADTMFTSSAGPYNVPEEHLDYANRRRLLITRLDQLSSDIYCFQEVQTPQHLLIPYLQAKGYDYTYVPQIYPLRMEGKSSDIDDLRYDLDVGLCTAWNRELFTCVAQTRLDISLLPNDYGAKTNVSVVLLQENTPNRSSSGSSDDSKDDNNGNNNQNQIKRYIIAANTHYFFTGNRGETKLVHSHVIMNAIECWLRYLDETSNYFKQQYQISIQSQTQSSSPFNTENTIEVNMKTEVDIIPPPCMNPSYLYCRYSPQSTSCLDSNEISSHIQHQTELFQQYIQSSTPTTSTTSDHTPRQISPIDISLDDIISIENQSQIPYKNTDMYVPVMYHYLYDQHTTNRVYTPALWSSNIPPLTRMIPISPDTDPKLQALVSNNALPPSKQTAMIYFPKLITVNSVSALDQAQSQSPTQSQAHMQSQTFLSQANIIFSGDFNSTSNSPITEYLQSGVLLGPQFPYPDDYTILCGILKDTIFRKSKNTETILQKSINHQFIKYCLAKFLRKTHANPAGVVVPTYLAKQIQFDLYNRHNATISELESKGSSKSGYPDYSDYFDYSDYASSIYKLLTNCTAQYIRINTIDGTRVQATLSSLFSRLYYPDFILSPLFNLRLSNNGRDSSDHSSESNVNNDHNCSNKNNHTNNTYDHNLLLQYLQKREEQFHKQKRVSIEMKQRQDNCLMKYINQFVSHSQSFQNTASNPYSNSNSATHTTRKSYFGNIPAYISILFRYLVFDTKERRQYMFQYLSLDKYILNQNTPHLKLQQHQQQFLPIEENLGTGYFNSLNSPLVQQIYSYVRMSSNARENISDDDNDDNDDDDDNNDNEDSDDNRDDNNEDLKDNIESNFRRFIKKSNDISGTMNLASLPPTAPTSTLNEIEGLFYSNSSQALDSFTFKHIEKFDPNSFFPTSSKKNNIITNWANFIMDAHDYTSKSAKYRSEEYYKLYEMEEYSQTYVKRSEDSDSDDNDGSNRWTGSIESIGNNDYSMDNIDNTDKTKLTTLINTENIEADIDINIDIPIENVKDNDSNNFSDSSDDESLSSEEDMDEVNMNDYENHYAQRITLDHMKQLYYATLSLEIEEILSSKLITQQIKNKNYGVGTMNPSTPGKAKYYHQENIFGLSHKDILQSYLPVLTHGFGPLQSAYIHHSIPIGFRPSLFSKTAVDHIFYSATAPFITSATHESSGSSSIPLSIPIPSLKVEKVLISKNLKVVLTKPSPNEYEPSDHIPIMTNFTLYDQ